MSKKLSIITTVHNKLEYLEDYFSSFLYSKYFLEQVELIIIDDFSTDGSWEFLENKKKTFDFILKRNKENIGLSRSRNEAIIMTSGEFLCFLDADDWLSKGAVDYLVELTEKSEDTDIIIFDNNNCTIFTNVEIDRTEEDLQKAEYIDYLTFHQIGVCVKLFKKHIFDKIKFEPNMYYEDLYFQAELFLVKKLKILNTNMKLYNYRKNDISITGSIFTEKKYDDYVKCFEFFKKTNSQILFEFSVLRARRHLLRQAKKSDYGYDFYLKKINDYLEVNNIDESNPIYQLWLEKVPQEKKKILNDIIMGEPIIAAYLKSKNKEIIQFKKQRINSSVWKKMSNMLKK